MVLSVEGQNRVSRCARSGSTVENEIAFVRARGKVQKTPDETHWFWKLQNHLIVKKLSQVSSTLLRIESVNDREWLCPAFLTTLVYEVLLVRNRIACGDLGKNNFGSLE